MYTRPYYETWAPRTRCPYYNPQFKMCLRTVDGKVIRKYCKHKCAEFMHLPRPAK